MTLADITIQKTIIKDSQNNDIIHYTITDADGNTLKVAPGDDLYDDTVKLHMRKKDQNKGCDITPFIFYYVPNIDIVNRIFNTFDYILYMYNE